MIDKAMVKNKIERIEEDLLHLKGFVGFSFDKVAKSYNTHKIVDAL